MWYKLFLPVYKKSAQKMIEECRPYILKNSKILDIGCGSGIVTSYLEKNFNAEILGVDIKDRRIFSVPFKTFDGLSLPVFQNYFDVAFISYVLHHSENPVLLLSEAKRVAQKIIIYEDLPSNFISRFLCKMHGIFYNLFFQKQKNLNFKTEFQWREIFDDLGLRLIYQKIFKGNFLYPVQKALFVLEK
jgi:ubiquinone/menaquinone biosynthesis C-methylase UbiE